MIPLHRPRYLLISVFLLLLSGYILAPFPLRAAETEVHALDTALQLEPEAAPWFHDAVLYQIFPRIYGDGTLRAVTENLEAIRDLGVNTIYLMPVHEIGRVRRIGALGSPYSIRDHYSVAPELGTVDDLRTLVDRAHALGLRVLMDLVPNHTSYDNPLVTEAPSWYRLGPDGVPLPPVPEWRDVAQLDYSVPEVRAYMLDVARYWLRTAGIDGYRIDASVYVPFSFWLEFYPAIKAEFPDAFLLSESGGSWLLTAFDSQYDWEFEGVLGRVLRGQSALLLREHLGKLAASKRPKLIYLENHDHPRWLARYDRDSAPAAALVLLTAPAIPMLYAGQELGATHRPSLFDPDRLVTPNDRELYDIYRDLLHLRAIRPELSRGEYTAVDTSERDAVLAYLRGPYGDLDRAILVVVNLRGRAVEAALDLGPWVATAALWQSGGAAVECRSEQCTASLPAYGGAVYEVRLVRQGSAG